MKIVLGTTSEQKIEYVKEVLDNIGITAELFPVEVLSKVSAQPMSEEETEQGSINRAIGALEKHTAAEFSLGIEVGYHKNKEGYFEMFCCATIVDSQDFTKTCYSSKIVLPKFHQEVLKKNKDLGGSVREYKKGVNEPIANYIRELVRGRKPLIIEAIRNVLLAYLHKEDFV